jgi:general secretion pathway protein C
VVDDNQSMLSRLFAFAIWAAVTASLMFWGLRLLASPTQAPVHTVSAVDGQGTRGDLARLFGAPPANSVAAAVPAQVAQASSRFKLVGVAARRDDRDAGGLALISVDGKPARAIGVGRSIDDGWVLQSVTKRGAKLASNLGADTVDLEVPPMAMAQRGSLPPVSNSIDGSSTIVNPSAPSPRGFTGVPNTLSAIPGASSANNFGASAASANAAPTVVPNPQIMPSSGSSRFNGGDNRVVSPNPVMTPPASGAGAAASGPPAIYVPPEELVRQPSR